MSIQWHFGTTAKAFVSAQTVAQPLSSPSSSSSSLVELNHWTIEARSSVGGGVGGSSRTSSSSLSSVDVYLLHPPVLMPPFVNEANRLSNPTTLPSESSSSLLHDIGQNEREENVTSLEEAAEEYGMEFLEETEYYDPASIDCQQPKCYPTEWTFSIVFHETWRVPTLYFTCSQLDGTPLCRREVLDILLHHSGQRNRIEENGDDWNEEDLWEFLSQEEHPVTGVPSYFLHPCRTAERMEILLAHDGSKNQGEQHDCEVVCPLLSWMSMILPVVGCKISSEMYCQIGKSIAQKNLVG